MEWLDALRGFTMILVVAYHVCLVGFGENVRSSSSLSFLVLFRMPLFFFISGFLAYKSDFNWTRGRLGMMIWKKFKIQVIPTVVFMIVSAVVLKQKFWPGMMEMMESPTKGGYWFTWTLLLMFIIYYIFDFITTRFRCHTWVAVFLLWFAALAVYATCYMPSWFDYAQGHKHRDVAFLNVTSIYQVMLYFHFFLYGNIVHRYWTQFQRLFDSSWFLPLIVVLVFFCAFDILKWHTLQFQWTNLPRTLTMYIMLTIVFMFFRYYKESFTKQRLVGRGLQYVGVRTLDIYLLHFLFIPDLKMFGQYFNAHRNNFVIDTTLGIVVAFVVIAFSVMVSNVLRMNPFMKKYLFGRK